MLEYKERNTLRTLAVVIPSYEHDKAIYGFRGALLFQNGSSCRARAFSKNGPVHACYTIEQHRLGCYHEIVEQSLVSRICKEA